MMVLREAASLESLPALADAVLSVSFCGRLDPAFSILEGSSGRRVPQALQNREPVSLSESQLGQCMSRLSYH